MPEEIWPLYHWYGLSTISEIVEACMASLKGKSIHEQFRQQYVKRILLTKADGTLSDASLGPSCFFYPSVNSGFIIFLVNRPCVISVAHEFGHTFEFCLEGEFFPDWQIRLNQIEHYFKFGIEIEGLAQAFAERWIGEGTNFRDMYALLEAHQEKSSISF